MADAGHDLGDDDPLPDTHQTQNEFTDGNFIGNLVQAGTITGDITIHATAPAARLAPRELPPDTNGFVGRTAELIQLEELLATKTHSAAKFALWHYLPC